MEGDKDAGGGRQSHSPTGYRPTPAIPSIRQTASMTAGGNTAIQRMQASTPLHPTMSASDASGSTLDALSIQPQSETRLNTMEQRLEFTERQLRLLTSNMERLMVGTGATASPATTSGPRGPLLTGTPATASTMIPPVTTSPSTTASFAPAAAFASSNFVLRTSSSTPAPLRPLTGSSVNSPSFLPTGPTPVVHASTTPSDSPFGFPPQVPPTVASPTTTGAGADSSAPAGRAGLAVTRGVSSDGDRSLGSGVDNGVGGGGGGGSAGGSTVPSRRDPAPAIPRVHIDAGGGGAGSSQPQQFHHPPRGRSDIVRVNVGGTVFTTRRSTLCAVEGSFLEAMFSGRFPEDIDENGCIFIDRDPTHFGIILNWLRDRGAPREFPRNEAFLHEVQYYGLQESMYNSNVLYVFGGREERQGYGRMNERFDCIHNKWTVLAPMPAPRGYHAAVALGGRLYVCGGYDGAQQLRSVIRYNPVYDEWHEVASMLVARSVVSCVTYMGKIYAFGGFAGVDTLDSAEVYETETNTWRAIAPMPRKRRRHACAELGGYIYVVGGENGLLITNDVFRYNPRDDTWTSVASMVTQRYGHACAVLGDKLIAVGGYDGAEQLRSAEQYDSLTDQWVPMPQMNTWRAYAACGVLMGQIFVTGGYDGAEDQRSVEMYNPVTRDWTVSCPMSRGRSGVATVAC